MIAFNESSLHKFERYSLCASNNAINYLFYPVSIGHFYSNEKYEFSPADEQGYFLIFVSKGNFQLQLNNKKYKLIQNSLIITNANDAQKYYSSSSNLEYYFMHFDGNNVSTMLQFINNQSGTIITPANPKIIKKNIKSILLSLKEKKMLSESQMSAKIYEILCECLQQSKKDTKKYFVDKADYEDTIALAEKYIIDNINTPLSVKSIAKQVHMSSSHFSKIFKLETGFSPYDYVLDARLKKAKEYLCNTDKSIEQIAFLTGFNSESNFVYFFTTNTGISPLKYRKQNFNQ